MNKLSRILINASTCVVGGGVQVSVGFLHFVYHNLSKNEWDVVIVASPKVYEQCKDLLDHLRWKIIKVTPSPASPIKGRMSRMLIHDIIEEFKPVMCFTVFGPSYLWLNIPELCGFADPFVTNPNKFCLENHPIGSRLATIFRSWIKKHAVKRVTEFWVETKTAREGLARKVGCSISNISVVSNSLNPLFVPMVEPPPKGRFRFLLLSSFYHHKNFAILIPTAQALINTAPDFLFEFALTLPSDHPGWLKLQTEIKRLNLSSFFCNIGYLTVKDCPRAYRDCSVVFHPSLIEVFSATYLEAFASGRPLVATNLDFAREICRDAALYFEPTSPESAAQALLRAVRDSDYQNTLIKNGFRRLSEFPAAEEKNEQLVSLLNSFIERHCRAGGCVNE